MAKKNGVRKYLAEIGRKGGQKKVSKGFATLSEADRKKIARKAAAARWKGRKSE
jgi:hypothetical protein